MGKLSEKELTIWEKTRDLNAELMRGLREMKRGGWARAATGLSQTAFAGLLGVSVRTLQEWERGRKIPSGAAATLVKVAAKHPNVLKELAA
ncbi:MAG: helix-turn-helix domain-containing protein [candidate division NC10 bacterium]|nr:helix-turn-helix domain-containing protein [candidate division NC10 bacterium]